MSEAATAEGSSPSVYAAGEIRAHLARQRMSQRDLASTLGVGPIWLHRRIGPTPSVALTLDDLGRIADALGVPLSALTP